MLNCINLLGRLTRDPELKTTQSGVSVAKFTLAVDRPKYGDSEKKTDFIDVIAWRKKAEFVSNYFNKGQLVYVSGRLETRSWEGDDGKKRYAFEINAEEVGFAESRKNDADSGGQNMAMPDFDPFDDVASPF